MPRTMSSANISAWRMKQLINDLALGEKPHAELATDYDVAGQTVAAFALRHRADINAKKADWASEYDHIWSTRKENRLRVLTCRLEEVEDQIAIIKDHAQREYEDTLNVSPDAAPVLFNDRVYLAYVKEQRALLRAQFRCAT
jgi:hypothetical protein